MKNSHKERAHSKFSASGAERWFNCPGSVELSEGIVDKESPWALEGTKAHEVLEVILKQMIERNPSNAFVPEFPKDVSKEMIFFGTNAAIFIMRLHRELPGSEILVESKVYLDFIHPEAFGTFDGAVIDHFGTLHVFDYKFGSGHSVSPKNNMQMIFYGLGLAHKYNWNFKSVRLWIIQPRIRGYDGPTFWQLSIGELKEYEEYFKTAIQIVLDNPEIYNEGSWCHWCKAKSICPIKIDNKFDQAKDIFSNNIKEGASNAKIKKEARWFKEESAAFEETENFY